MDDTERCPHDGYGHGLMTILNDNDGQLLAINIVIRCNNNNNDDNNNDMINRNKDKCFYI